jgi:hypothetical protein
MSSSTASDGATNAKSPSVSFFSMLAGLFGDSKAVQANGSNSGDGSSLAGKSQKEVPEKRNREKDNPATANSDCLATSANLQQSCLIRPSSISLNEGTTNRGRGEESNLGEPSSIKMSDSSLAPRAAAEFTLPPSAAFDAHPGTICPAAGAAEQESTGTDSSQTSKPASFQGPGVSVSELKTPGFEKSLTGVAAHASGNALPDPDAGALRALASESKGISIADSGTETASLTGPEITSVLSGQNAVAAQAVQRSIEMGEDFAEQALSRPDSLSSQKNIDKVPATKNLSLTARRTLGNNELGKGELQSSSTASPDGNDRPSTIAQSADQHPQDTQQPSLTARSTSLTSLLSVAVPNPANSERSQEPSAGLRSEAPSESVGARILDQIRHDDSALTPGINTAHLMQTMSQSEMRVGISSPDFGAISVRTAISQQQMIAQISVDHRELGGAISSHTTALAAKLGSEYGMHATIEVKQSGAGLFADRDQSQRQQQQQEQQPVYRWSALATEQPDAAGRHLLHIPSESGDSDRLDIRA